jgi:hypothetical protein
MVRISFFSLSALLVIAGCSSDPATPAAPADGGTDTVPVDTGRPDTAKPDTGMPPLSCEEEVPSDFACTAPTKVAGQTVCTEAALQELAEKCLNADVTVPAACAEWKAAHAACATCVGAWSWSAISGKIYPDDYLCYWAVMDDTCGKSVNCWFECNDTVCAECDREPDSTGTSDSNRCYTAQESAGSKCWDVAGKAGTACFEKFDTSGCNVNEIYKSSPNLDEMKKQIVRLLRGACRDGGNWANAESPGDAGPADSGSDTGSDTESDAGADTTASDAADAD